MSIIYGPYSNISFATTLSAFDPIDEPHLELYLSSILGMGGYSNGQSITNWPDQSGNSRDAVTAGGFTEPTYSTADLTPLGQPTVSWQGLVNGLINASAFAWTNIGLRGYTFHWYGRTEAKSAPPYDFVNQALFGSITIGRPGVLVHSGGGSGKYGFIDNAGGGAPKVFGTHASIANQYHLHSLVLPLPDNNTVPMLYYLDGVLQTQTGGATNYQCATPSPTSQYIIGNGATGNVAFKGKQGFFLWYSDTHDATKVGDFADYVDNVWGF